MNIIQPSFNVSVHGEALTPDLGVWLLRWIERNARISHRSEDAQTYESWRRFIEAVVIQHGDWSVVEHATATVTFRVDRGVTHELVRHRLFSFTQESTRFVNYGKSNSKIPHPLEFIKPSFAGDDPVKASAAWNAEIYSAERAYLDQLDMGQPPQIARSLLPNATAATISVTGNLRNWRHFLLMRTSQETHPDFRRVTIPLLAEFQRCIPILYADIEPNARQIDNLKKAR
jgi:thymidylate synthase (FAD)